MNISCCRLINLYFSLPILSVSRIPHSQQRQQHETKRIAMNCRKTTTMVEAVYQLANLHKYNNNKIKIETNKKRQVNNNKKLKILLIAPSTDATDILVEKLSPYFPPSEMIRVLAYTRSIYQVSEGARPYCEEGLESKLLISKIMNCQITVATVNMAARLWCTGGNNKKSNGGDCIPRGYFDVLCVDEAGHATEPEVIAVAATLMNFHEDNNNDNPGQIILAGDPQQLGPIITSNLCKKCKMDQSYMERLIKTCPPYMLESNNNNKYRPELVTLLVDNYRSHPDILKLPNEMFYRNELIPRGDKFTTHSMTKWEHLPVPNFPIIFHAVDGENSREGSSPSWFNIEEAMVVVDYVNNLVKHSKPKISQDDIGVITPYARQVQKVSFFLM
jgi:helicase MOV-10